MGGLRRTAPMRTAFQLMRGASLTEAVVVADAYAFTGLVELPWLWAYVDAHRRWPAVEHARRAVRLACSRAASPGESRLRMVAVLGGLPVPLVNPSFWRGDVLIGRPDLVLQAKRMAAVEYDGAYHEDAAQHRADNRSENGLVLRGGPAAPALRPVNRRATC